MTTSVPPAISLLSQVAGVAETAGPSVNKFPVEVFPNKVKEIITETHKVLNYAPDFTGAGMLAAAAAAIGNSCVININGEFQAIAALFVLGVGSSAIGKSQPFEFALKPLQKIDAQRFAQYEHHYNEFERISKLNDAERKAQGIEAAPVEPIVQKTLIDDFTPEALAKLLKYNPRGLCVYNDEFSTYLGNSGRYNKSGEESKMLSLLDGKPFSIDRKVGRAIHVPKPNVTLTGTLQDELISVFAGGSRNVNGFVFRALVAWPENIIKQKKSDTSGAVKMDSFYKYGWEQIITTLSGIELSFDQNSTPEPKELFISTEAGKIHTVWYNKNVDIANESDESHVKSICGKLEIMVYRLALIMQLLNHAAGEGGSDCIEPKAMSAAISLIEYFRITALRVQNKVSNADPLENAPQRIKQFYIQLPDTFTTSEAKGIAAPIGMNDKAVTRALEKHKDLFIKVAHGKYEKAA